MKNNNGRKFNYQISHLQSFIGMPMWNGRNPSISEIRAIDRRRLEQQALEKQNQEQQAIKFENLKKRFMYFLKEVFMKRLKNLRNSMTNKQQKNTECC